jgi:hypothetical protein
MGMMVSVIGSDFFPKNFAAFSTKRIGRLLDSFFPPQFGLIFEIYGQNCLNFDIIRLKNPHVREVTMPNNRVFLILEEMWPPAKFYSTWKIR